MACKGNAKQEEMEWKASDEQVVATQKEGDVDNSMDNDDDFDTNSLPESDTTYNLEDDITPPKITPRESSESGSADLDDTSSENSEEIIPKYLFSTPSKSRLLNIEFNRCLLLDFDPLPSTSKTEDSNNEVIMTPRSLNSEEDDDDDDSSRYDNYRPAVQFVPLMLNRFNTENTERIIPPYLFVSNEDALSDISLSLESEVDSKETERETGALSTYRSILSCDYSSEEENLQLSRFIENNWLCEETLDSDPDDAELLWIEKLFWDDDDENDNILYNETNSVSSENSISDQDN